MHELSVTQSILEIALRQAEIAGAGRITDVYLVVGQLSSIVDDSVQFYWDMIAKETIAEGARLQFRRVPAEMVCLDCNERYLMSADFACPLCGSRTVRVVAGEEFYLEAIDVEMSEVSHPSPWSGSPAANEGSEAAHSDRREGERYGVAEVGTGEPLSFSKQGSKNTT